MLISHFSFTFICLLYLVYERKGISFCTGEDVIVTSFYAFILRRLSPLPPSYDTINSLPGTRGASVEDRCREERMRKETTERRRNKSEGGTSEESTDWTQGKGVGWEKRIHWVNKGTENCRNTNTEVSCIGVRSGEETRALS